LIGTAVPPLVNALTDAIIQKIRADTQPTVQANVAAAPPDGKVAIVTNENQQRPTQPAPLAPSAEQEAVPVGLAYEIYRVMPDGSEVLVPPDQLSFKTGDRFVVLFMANVPSMIEAYNIDGQGVMKQLGTWMVGGAEPFRLPAQGTFRFTGTPGDEVLQLQLYPCRAADVGANGIRGGGTRGITIDPGVVSVLRPCGLNTAHTAQRTLTRSIEVDHQGNTGIAVGMYSKAELMSGNTEPQTIKIRFLHR
jgi:hypothetical protein